MEKQACRFPVEERNFMDVCPLYGSIRYRIRVLISDLVYGGKQSAFTGRSIGSLGVLDTDKAVLGKFCPGL